MSTVWSAIQAVVFSVYSLQILALQRTVDLSCVALCTPFGF